MDKATYAAALKRELHFYQTQGNESRAKDVLAELKKLGVEPERKVTGPPETKAAPSKKKG